ncbi:MAG: SusC/RagA family TonB-linked outer membrane protein [Flavobacterium sp.]|nr:MAG: SusC/RagA family TonB-linked outer membrane protein [Flavobacterium sp.]
MKSKFTWIFTLLLAFFIQFSYAQERAITGVVTDAQGMPIPGATVRVDGSANQGVQTNFDGVYTIQASTGQKLVFSFIGMGTKTVTVGASSSVSVQMEDDATILDPVVIEGYRTTSRRQSNVAVTTISAETIEGRPNVSFIQSLQGQIPGLNISTGSGSPGSSNTSVILRGLGSLTGNTEPLYVIDGVPSNVSNFRSINGNDIESVSVLKDAGATSVYGNRGANGVIVVKTKRGAFDSDLRVRYSSVTGFTTLQKHRYNIMSGPQLLRLERERGLGDGATAGEGGSPLTDAQIAAAPNTDWEDYFFRTGISQDHNLSFSQGSKNTNSFISLGYFEQEGIVPNTDIKRISVRSNFTGKSTNDRFNYTTNLYAGYSVRNQLEAETRADIAGNVLQNPLQGMLSSLPYLDPNFYQSGQQLFDAVGGATFRNTPYMLMDYLENIYNRYNEVKLLFNGSASYKITNELTFGVTGGIDFTENQRVFARLPESYLAIVAAAEPPIGAGYPDFPGLELQSTTRDFAFNGNTRLNYNKVIGEKHTIDASLMTEYYKAHYNAMQYQTIGLNDRTYEPGAGTGYVPFNPGTPNLFQRSVAGSKLRAGLFSYFGMVDYDYDSKYGIGLSLRRDASYRFEDENQWGTFWSASARWNIDQESFMEGSAITELKLRASYGTSGNQNIGGESPYAAPNPTRSLFATTNGYANQSGIGLSQLGNPTAKWETTEQANIGLDFVYNKRLSGTIDVYRKYTKDLYQTYPISAINGTYGVLANVGNMENKGVELLLNYDVFKGGVDGFNLRLMANGSYNQNRLRNMPGGDQFIGDTQVNSSDEVAFQWFAVEYAGVNPVNGNSLFYTADGGLTENPTTDDRKRTGKSPIPVYQGGFGFEADYKGFYATTQFTFVADVWRFDSDLDNLTDPTSIGLFPQTQDQLRAWTPDNRNTDIPSITATNTASEDFSDRFLRDGSYLRLKRAAIGYNVPAKMLEQTFLNGVRFYVQGENFLTWTKWRGFDPESNGAQTFGGYPTPRVFSLGLDLSF